ncbi:MAG TPA: ABC transporter ATP-binding protein [Gaiellaceae bacterium]|jgi:ABC-type polysaccharide/polyol phosphate transport system ATPase subunit|nr:ABC transporter ATP-binding protein [Gaiellaceae bacterium]
MRKGEIAVEGASRRFLVHAQANRTLKDWFVARGRLRASEVWALRDVSLHVEPGEAVGLVGRNGSGKTTLLRLVSGIVKPTGGRVETGGRVASLLELGAGFHPDFSGRENVYLNGSIHGLKRRRIDELMDEIVAFAELERFVDLPVRTYSSGMYMRLGFAVAAHIQADVLLLDEVFAVGDEAFQRKCFGKIFEFKQRGGTIVFVSHDAAAVERLCDRAILLRGGTKVFDGPTHEAIVRYHQALAAEESPDELQAGLGSWGDLRARIEEVSVLDGDGDARVQFAAGEPLTVRLRVACDAPLPPPRLSLELSDDHGILLASASQDTAELGWEAAPGEKLLRFELDRLPLSDGRFHLRFTLADAAGQLHHRLDDAAQFLVVPPGGERGALLLEGRWSMQENAAPAEISQS